MFLGCLDPRSVLRNTGIDIRNASCAANSERGNSDQFVAHSQRRSRISSANSLTKLGESTNVCVRNKIGEVVESQIGSALLVGNNRSLEILQLQRLLAEGLSVSPSGDGCKLFGSSECCRHLGEGSVCVLVDCCGSLNQGNVVVSGVEVETVVQDKGTGLMLYSSLVVDVSSSANSERSGPVDYQTRSSTDDPTIAYDGRSTEVSMLLCLQRSNVK